MAVAAPFTEITTGVYRIELDYGGLVTTVLIDVDGELTLFDAGVPGFADEIEGAIAAVGYGIRALRRIVVSHAHHDHCGSAAELRERSGAEILMTQADAELVANGLSGRGMVIAPGREHTAGAWIHEVDLSVPLPIESFEVDGLLEPGSAVSGLEGSEVIACPGHCEGQVAVLLYRDDGILLAADAANNVAGVSVAPIHEDVALAWRSFDALAERDFEIVVFGHGPAIVSSASAAFRDVATVKGR